LPGKRRALIHPKALLKWGKKEALRLRSNKGKGRDIEGLSEGWVTRERPRF